MADKKKLWLMSS